MPPLKLSAPESTKVAIYLTIVILKHTRVDREGTTNGLIHRFERSLGLVGHSNTQTEYAIVGLGREDKVVLAILLDAVIVPHLLLSPGHILHVKDNTMVCGIVILDIVPREHMVVLHLEVTAIVVETLTGIPVMRWVDVKTSVKHIG
jgi:hypothetical protein